MSYNKFAENLRKLRTEHKLTQAEFGKHLGLSKAVVSKYENAIGYPTFDCLINIAAYFGVTTDYLLGIENAKTADISGLSDSQLAAVLRIISEFRQANG